MSIYYIIYFVYMTLLSIFGTIFNLVILLVYRNRTSSNASVFLLWSLALVDLVVSACIIPMTIFSSIEQFFVNDLFYCGLIYFMRYFCSSISCFLLGLIALERYKIISAKTMTRLRFLQKNLVYNTKRAIVVAVVLCFITAVWCFVFYEPNTISKTCTPKKKIYIFNFEFYFEVYSKFCIVILVLIMIIMVILYIKSYLVVKKATNRIFIKNLDSYQPKKTFIFNLLVRLTNSDSQSNNKEINLPKFSTKLAEKNENNENLKKEFDFRYNYFKTSNSCFLSESNQSDMPKTCSYESFKNKDSKINTISEIVDQKQSTDRINQMFKDNLKCKAQNYILKEPNLKENIAKLFFINNEVNEVVDAVDSPKEQAFIFRKRVSNFSVWNSFLRKDWKVAKMFFLVTIIFVLSWIPWMLSSLDIINHNIFWSNLYILNNIINPIIYSFLSKSFRKDFFFLAKSLRKKFFFYLKLC